MLHNDCAINKYDRVTNNLIAHIEILKRLSGSGWFGGLTDFFLFFTVAFDRLFYVK